MKPSHRDALQIAFGAALVAVVAGMATTAHDNLARQGVSTGFGFLLDRTGWDVSASLLSQGPADAYWWTFVVGLANTLLLAIVCTVVATTGGLLLALLESGESRILAALT